jgi:HAD superfamily hydrolase (TIGR01509 family)
MSLRNVRNWVFDMDGTLTVAVHDFAAIKRELDLPLDQPILESLDQLPAALAQEKRRRLDEIEFELVKATQPAPGAYALLETLARNGFARGIVTRNTLENAWATLEAAGLREFFAPGDVLGRGCALPKPSPAGVDHLLTRWQARRDESAMVGDYHFDLQAGRAAGVKTVLVGTMESPEWSVWCDLHVGDLSGILADLQA